MTGIVVSELVVPGMENGLGKCYAGSRAATDDVGGSVPLFHHVLDPGRYWVAFEPTSEAYRVLANDQNRFSPPRSLPPVLDLRLPEEVDNPTGAYVVTRYAYSEGAYRLLEDLLAEGHVFGMNGFLEFAWQLAQALAWLHEHGIVHGQWNARSVVAIQTEELAHPLLETSGLRFEVLHTGVCYRDAATIPPEYLERGYYPPEVFLSEKDMPDYGALDLVGDVFCCAAFLKDLMQRGCSSEELPSQARRILEELQKEANRRGWKASPESVRRKEMEILDHLYTIRVRTESLIQEGLRPREERCDAGQLLASVEDLHEKATSYLQELFARGFEPVNVFDDELQHYTTFQLEVSPRAINSYEDSRVRLAGRGLPQDMVRVTLNESHQGVTVLYAGPESIEFRVGAGLRSGVYRISVNNRRTNGSLEVYTPVWHALEPAEAHQPWEGFGNIQLRVRGENLPTEVEYALRPSAGAMEDGSRPRRSGEEHDVPAVVVLPVGSEQVAAGCHLLQLTFPCDTGAGEYELFANGLTTGLRASILEQLPDPMLDENGLVPDLVKNHRSRALRLRGRDFHPSMVVDFGAAGQDVRLSVTSTTDAELEIGEGFPAGEHRLRLNYRETGARLQVIEPRWTGQVPGGVKLSRDQRQPVTVDVVGDSLPDAGDGLDYRLARRGEVVQGGVIGVEELEPERVHRLRLAPKLPRGRCGIRFGELETGLQFQVRRQWPRTAWAAVLLVGVGILGGIGAALHEAFMPTIHEVTPATLFAFGDPPVTVRGAYLDRVELLDSEGALVAGFPVQELDEPGLFRFEPRGLGSGEFRLKPVGPLYAAPPSEHVLTLRSPAFGFAPEEVHRLQDSSVRISAADGFDLSTIAYLEMQPVEPGGELLRIPVSGGRAELPRGSFSREAEGDHRITLDGKEVTNGDGSPALLRVVGPRVSAIAPDPVTRDAEGRITVSLEGTGLRPVRTFLLAEAEVQPQDPEDFVTLEATEDRYFRASVSPGSYRLYLAGEGMRPEPVPEAGLVVLPTPVVTEVTPRKLDPGAETTITVVGTNLRALERLVLVPDGAATSVEVPVDRERVSGRWGLESVYEFDVALPSGTWRVQPAEAALKVEVYDDCQDALETFARSGDAEALLRCLEEGRPPESVRVAAADLLFDRGLFEPARELYGGAGDLRSRFRAHFVDAFVLGSSVPLWSLDGVDRVAPSAVAAIRLGWAGAESAEFAPGVELTWELEFVRGWTAEDTEVRASAFRRSIDKKSRAAGGFEVAAFEPAHRQLARSELELAVERITRLQPTEARATLRRLTEDREAWGYLDDADRARALFWLGHLELWYSGDLDRAVAILSRAFEAGEEPVATWSREYLLSVHEGSRSSDPVVFDPTSWAGVFVRVHRLFAEATESPNYNLLSTDAGRGAYLSEQERQKSAELHAQLEKLEQLRPGDPFAHHALLWSLRQAQRVSWPASADEHLADEHRARLQGLGIPAELEPLREYYIVRGELEPYDYAQITTLSRAERSRLAERIEALEPMPLPAALRESADRLKRRFLNPSVVWWREANK